MPTRILNRIARLLINPLPGLARPYPQGSR
jgi:hypothetical protein